MKRYRALFLCSVALVIGSTGLAQDLEPRAYSASPIGANFVAVGFSRSSGPVVFDPSIPVVDVSANTYSPFVGLGRTFGLFGRQALATAALPYAWGTIEGKVGPQLQQGSTSRSGLADLRAKFSINLHGSPALNPAQFAQRPKRTYILAASLTMQAPSGQYDSTKLINLGTNRWAFKPEVGFSYPVKKFYFDLYGGIWWFTENSHFFPGGDTRKQDPLFSLQAHISYNVRTHFWVAFDGTWYAGAATHLNGGPPISRQDNTRLGATGPLPLNKHQSLKLSYSNGVSARTGSNFSTVTATWQLLWF